MYFPIDYYRFRNYRNIGAVFVFDNIVSISFSRKKCDNKSDLATYRSFPIVFIPNGGAALLPRTVLWEQNVVQGLLQSSDQTDKRGPALKRTRLRSIGISGFGLSETVFYESESL